MRLWLDVTDCALLQRWIEPRCSWMPPRTGRHAHQAALSLNAVNIPRMQHVIKQSWNVSSPGMQFSSWSPGGAGGGSVEVRRTGGRAAGVRVGGKSADSQSQVQALTFRVQVSISSWSSSCSSSSWTTSRSCTASSSTASSSWGTDGHHPVMSLWQILKFQLVWGVVWRVSYLLRVNRDQRWTTLTDAWNIKGKNEIQNNVSATMIKNRYYGCTGIVTHKKNYCKCFWQITANNFHADFFRLLKNLFYQDPKITNKNFFCHCFRFAAKIVHITLTSIVLIPWQIPPEKFQIITIFGSQRRINVSFHNAFLHEVY